MREVILRPEVDTDMEDVVDYTIGQWGHEQALFYIGELRAGIERLAQTAMRHPLDSELHPGLRRMKINHHFVYYLVDGEVVEVVRVLHEKRDSRRQLSMK